MRSEAWTEQAARKRVLIKDGSGPGLLYENGSLYVHDGEGHVLYLGVSGSGKTRRGTMILTRQIIKNKESAVIVDPKGEIYANTKDMIPSDYGVHVIDFRNLEESECWNPLSAPYVLWSSGTKKNKRIAEQIIENLALALYPNATKNMDPFWNSSGRSVFTSAVYALFACAKPEQINLASVFYLISKGQERCGTSCYLKEFVKMLESDENIVMGLQSYVTTAEETAAGIRSVFMDGLSLATKSESVREFTSRDDLKINELKGDAATLIYIILPDQTEIYDALGGILVSQLMTHYVMIADQDYNGRLPIKLHFLIEELGNVGRAITNLPHLLTAGRSRGIRCELVVQSLSQIIEVYGQSNATTILSNCDVRIAFRVNHLDTLDELSRMCGEREVEHVNGTISREPLISPSALGAMETGQALISISGGRVKYITKLPDFSELHVSSIRPAKKAIAIKGERNKVSYFDVRDYVKKKKEENNNLKTLPSYGKKTDDNHSSEEKQNWRLDPREVFPDGLHDDTPISNDKSLDEIIAELSKLIDETEAQERAEKEKQNTSSGVAVLVTCEHEERKITEISKIISRHSKITVAEAKKRLKSDNCVRVQFKSIAPAQKFVSEISEAGGAAWFDAR